LRHLDSAHLSGSQTVPWPLVLRHLDSAHLSGSQTVPWPLVLRHLASAELLFYCSVFMFTSKYSVLILDCIPGILIPLIIIITQVNKQHTADCTIFVLL
jgi:hypothetical protein